MQNFIRIKMDQYIYLIDFQFVLLGDFNFLNGAMQINMPTTLFQMSV